MTRKSWLTLVKDHLVDIKGAGWTDENLTAIKSLIDAIKAVTDALPAEFSALALEATLASHDTDIKALLATIVGHIDTEIAAIVADLDNPDQYKADVAALALEATLTAIKGGGWTDETLKAIKDAIDSIAGVNSYQEQIPDTDFSLALIDDELTADPPSADAENSVVDIDQNAGDTFVLRSLLVDITSFGTTGGTKLTFALWGLVNGVVKKVDEVDVSSLGLQNLMDLFGIQEVHADAIWITVLTDATDEPGDAACEGTFKWAKAS